MVNEGASESPPPKRDDASAASPERAALAATVNEEEARLRRLEAEHADAKACGPGEAVPASLGGPGDLYPTRFVSKKMGKAGHAPACSNKFVTGVCELPKVKCDDFTNEAFLHYPFGAWLVQFGSTSTSEPGR